MIHDQGYNETLPRQPNATLPTCLVLFVAMRKWERPHISMGLQHHPYEKYAELFLYLPDYLHFK